MRLGQPRFGDADGENYAVHVSCRIYCSSSERLCTDLLLVETTHYSRVLNFGFYFSAGRLGCVRCAARSCVRLAYQGYSHSSFHPPNNSQSSRRNAGGAAVILFPRQPDHTINSIVAHHKLTSHEAPHSLTQRSHSPRENVGGRVLPSKV